MVFEPTVNDWSCHFTFKYTYYLWRQYSIAFLSHWVKPLLILSFSSLSALATNRQSLQRSRNPNTLLVEVNVEQTGRKKPRPRQKYAIRKSTKEQGVLQALPGQVPPPPPREDRLLRPQTLDRAAQGQVQHPKVPPCRALHQQVLHLPGRLQSNRLWPCISKCVLLRAWPLRPKVWLEELSRRILHRPFGRKTFVAQIEQWR